MGVTVNVTSTVPAMLQRLESLPAQVAQKAMQRTLNRVKIQARTRMADAIYSEFNLQKSKVNAKLFTAGPRMEPAGRLLTMTATLFSAGRGRALNLIHFADKRSKRSRGARSGRGSRSRDGVWVQVKRGGGLKRLKGNAFIGNNGRTVFERVGRGRLPIVPVQTIDVPQMFNTRRINDRVRREIVGLVTKRFDHEAQFALQQYLRGSWASLARSAVR